MELRRIKVIKAVKDATGLGLKEAKKLLTEHLRLLRKEFLRKKLKLLRSS